MDMVFAKSVLIVFVCLVLYLLPSLVARHRKHKNGIPILLINICLGWSVIGWLIALIWSASSYVEETQFINQEG